MDAEAAGIVAELVVVLSTAGTPLRSTCSAVNRGKDVNLLIAARNVPMNSIKLYLLFDQEQGKAVTHFTEEAKLFLLLT